MTTATLVSAITYPQNTGGPPVPEPTVVNTGGLITKAGFTLTVTPPTGWAQVAVNWGPDGVNFPGQLSLYEAPTGTGTVTQEMRFHGALLEPGAGSAPDGPQYFKAEVMMVAPGASVTVTMTY